MPPRHPVPSLAADANASDAAEADAGICACKAADCDAASALSNMRTTAPSPPTQVNATSMFNEVDEDGDDCVTRAQWLAIGFGFGLGLGLGLGRGGRGRALNEAPPCL